MSTSVLIVESEPDLAELYAGWLEGSHDVETATDGDAARDALEDALDVVLVDRQAPGPSGEALLAAVRDLDLDCRVAAVTPVDPEVDLVGKGFDDVLVKPVSKDELSRLVDQLLLRSSYEELLQELFDLASKKATLDAETTEAERTSSEEYARLRDRLAVVRADLEETTAELLERDDYRRFCRVVSRESPCRR